MKLDVPYLKMRPGPNGIRPRWEPGPRLRARGWKGQDLKDAGGAWLDEGTAIARARELNGDVDAWRLRGCPRVQPHAPRKVARSGLALYELWIRSPAFAEDLAEKTRADYRSKAQVFLAEFGDVPVAAIKKSHMHSFWEELRGARGHAMANGVIAVARAMFSYAVLKDWRADNPALKLGITGVAPRQVLWLPAEVAAFVATADRMGGDYVGVADAVVVGLHSGQRLADVLALPDRLFEEARIRLSQAKTTARIDAPMTPALLARVAAIRARRQGGKIVALERPLIQRADGTPFDPSSLNKRFREVKARAIAAEAELASKNFQDLRDTAVTRLALAGCTLPEIGAITGHSQTSITEIIKHYLVLQPAMADAAIGKLTAWLNEQGIAL